MRKIQIVSTLCVAILITLGIASCHRKEIPQPTQTGVSGGGSISSQPIIENGVETGYAISYRSWIVPGQSENGHKAPTPPNTKSAYAYSSDKGGSTNDTVSVILHDAFYHVNTICQVSTWNPANYQSYTTHWELGLRQRETQNYITMMDSVYYLWIQYPEFSFCYELDFQVAHYNNGVVDRDMPYYHPIVQDLGAEALETMETTSRNDSVFARKQLRHSIKVTIGNKNYVLNAKVVLYRYLPDANPNKFIVRSEVVNEVYPTSLDDYSDDTHILLYYPYIGNIKRYYSDGTFDTYNIDISEHIFVFANQGAILLDNAAVNCDNVLSIYSFNNLQITEGATTETYADNYLKLYAHPKIFRVLFNGTTHHFDGELYGASFVYDDGYTFYQKSFDATCAYTHTEKECDDYGIYVKVFLNYNVCGLQVEYYTCKIWVE